MNTEKICFKENGKFRILAVSDFHAGNDYCKKLKTGFEALLENTKPDFVMLLGDQCLNKNTYDEVKSYMADIMEPVIKRNLPWSAIFGNHDREMGISVDEEIKAYSELPGFHGDAGPESISGVGNFIIPIYSENSEKIKFALWGLDSGLYQRNTLGHPKNELVLPDSPFGHNSDGTPDFSQVMWYYNESVKLENQAGEKINGIIFTHVPIPEFVYITKNPEECQARGNLREAPACAMISTGLFNAAVERRDIKGFFFGHDHLNDLQGEYLGITMAYDGALGYDMSAHDDLRGGRVIDIDISGNVETKMVSLWSIMGRDCMRNPDFMEGGCQYFIRKLF